MIHLQVDPQFRQIQTIGVRLIRHMLTIGAFLALQTAAATACDAFAPLNVRSVQVEGELGGRILKTVENNLLALDIENDFLRPFQQRTARDGYIGLGKLIEACARFAVLTDQPQVAARRKLLVQRVVALQEPDGYVGQFAPDARLWQLWDIHEIAYLIHGLTADYRLFGEADSLQAARRAADWLIDGWNAEPGRQPGGGVIMEYMAVTGVESALLSLYESTGERKYLDFCLNQRRLAQWDGPIVEGRWGPIQGHAYAYMARCIAQLRLQRINPRPQLLVPPRRAVDFLIRHDGLVVTGTCGQHECWHGTQEGAANLGETCTTAYLLRMLDELLRMEGSSRYGDLMERAVYNALFAAQSPDGRHIRYYTPFEGKRVYFEADTYCCPSNYRRILAELPAMVYYTIVEDIGGTNDQRQPSEDAAEVIEPAVTRSTPDLTAHEAAENSRGIVVNLYTASRATIDMAGSTVGITQATDYPSSGHIRLKIDPPRPMVFSVWLRIPSWCRDAALRINGIDQGGELRAGTFHAIRREWTAGDELQLELPMKLRIVRGRQAQAGRVAILFGPRVFCFNPAVNPHVTQADPRLITIAPESLSGPLADSTVRPGGLACKVKAWRTTNWYPAAEPDWELTLTEFPDPGGEATYFHVPNPHDPRFEDDELSAAK